MSIPDKYDDKLDEARYFLGRMEEEKTKVRPLTYYFRAFVSAARSVDEYVRKEATEKGKAGADAYRDMYVRRPILESFRLLRNMNLHERPVHAWRKTGETRTIHVAAVDAEGTSPAKSITIHAIAHAIDGWEGPGSGEVFESCGAYLAALESLLAEAEEKKVIARGV